MQTGAVEHECELYLAVQTGALHAEGPRVDSKAVSNVYEGGGSYATAPRAST